MTPDWTWRKPEQDGAWWHTRGECGPAWVTMAVHAETMEWRMSGKLADGIRMPDPAHLTDILLQVAMVGVGRCRDCGRPVEARNPIGPGRCACGGSA